jgi:hypothetical protein
LVGPAKIWIWAARQPVGGGKLWVSSLHLHAFLGIPMSWVD